MHTTALCSPSRSCIITGRNHHANGMAAITELASGFPGYDGVMPMENGFLSEILLENGYNTYMVGKWHLTPSNQETAVGPYDRWPLGRGFQTVLRIPGRRHQPVVSGTGLRQPPGRTPEDPGAGLPPHRGPDRQVDRVHRRRPAGRPGQAVLPAPVLRCHPRPAPRPGGMGRQVRREIRRWLGRLPGVDLRPAEGTGHHPGRRRAVPARSRRSRTGIHCPPRPGGCPAG